MPEFFGQQVHAQNSEGAEEDGPQFKREHAGAKCFECEGLEINEKTFTAVVVFVEEFEVSGFQGTQGVGSVGGFIRIDAGRNVFNVVASSSEGEQDYEGE